MDNCTSLASHHLKQNTHKARRIILFFSSTVSFLLGSGRAGHTHLCLLSLTPGSLLMAGLGGPYVVIESVVRHRQGDVLHAVLSLWPNNSFYHEFMGFQCDRNFRAGNSSKDWRYYMVSNTGSGPQAPKHCCEDPTLVSQ